MRAVAATNAGARRRNQRRKSLVQYLVCLLAFFLIFDLEISISGISGGGERVSLASSLVDGALVLKDEQEIGLKVTDFILLGLSIIGLMGIVSKDSAWRVSRTSWGHFSWLLLFVCVGLLGLIWNQSEYASSQIVICLLYLAKFGEITLVYLFTRAYFATEGRITRFFRYVCLAALLASIVGIVNPFTEIFSGWLIPERVSFYGPLMLVGSICMSLAISRVNARTVMGISNIQLGILLGAIGLAILVCDKRTVLMGTLVSFGYIVVMQLRSKNITRVLALSILSALVMSPFLVDQVDRALERDSIYIWEGLSEKYSNRLMDSWLASFSVGGLDYSFTERVAKWLLVLDGFWKHPVIGVGFWGAPFAVGLLPDSAVFQVLSEVGILGSTFAVIFLLRTWRFSKGTDDGSIDYPLGVGLRAGVLGFISMGLTANPLYTFNLLGVLLLFCAVGQQIYMQRKGQQGLI